MLREVVELLEKLPQKMAVETLETNVKNVVIGIVSAQNEFSFAQNHTDEIVKRVEKGVYAAGATAKVMHVASIDGKTFQGTQSAKYELPMREYTASAVEFLTSPDTFDGLVFVASDVTLVAGLLIGAIRCNVPCMFVSQGVMEPLCFDGKRHGIVEIYRQIARIKTGKTAYERLNEITENLPVASGTECESYADNGLNSMLEILGLAVEGNGYATANSPKRMEIAFETGKAVVEAATKKLTPAKIVDSNALCAAICCDLAAGGSPTALLHVIAIAKELHLRDVNLNTISDLSRSVPALFAPTDENEPLMETFKHNGGIFAIASQLLAGKVINGENILFDGSTLGDALKKFASVSPSIKTCQKPLQQSSLTRVLFGNAAEEGCICHHGADTDKTFVGVAKVFDNEEVAVDAILHREIRPDDVVVIKNEGPRSAPGMREIFVPFALLEGFELSDKVAVITDGRIPDFYKGFAVGHITPESHEIGTFSIINDGDPIEISLPKGKVSVDINSKYVSQRMKNVDGNSSYLTQLPYLKRFAKKCSTASEGCVIIDK